MNKLRISSYNNLWEHASKDFCMIMPTTGVDAGEEDIYKTDVYHSLLPEIFNGSTH